MIAFGRALRRHAVEIVASTVTASFVVMLLLVLPLPRVRPPGRPDAALVEATRYSLDSVTIGKVSTVLRWHPQPRLAPARADALSFAGWAVDAPERAPVTRVSAVVDGDATFTAETGLRRDDVAVALGNPALATSGFRLTIPACALAAGRHRIAFRFEAADGRGYFRSRDDVDVDVDGGPPATRAAYAVDAVEPALARPGVHVARGWLVDAGACALATGVRVSVDGRVVATANYGSARPDVARALGSPAFERSGFRATWSDASLARGSHELRLQAMLRASSGLQRAGSDIIDPGFALGFAR